MVMQILFILLCMASVYYFLKDGIMSNSVSISPEEYDRLLESEKKLNALEAGGVDNWEWYDDAMEAMEQ